jgi:hypothetical protein
MTPALRSKFQRAAHSAWFSYAAILLLQLKVIWGCWEVRDLTTGDTSSYFEMASHWAKTFHVALSWSPLYTSFYGSLLFFSSDAYVVTTAHRMIIVFLLAILVLALMRHLLPPGMAWLVAAWWVLLPIDFNSLYEVHLFAAIPTLLSILAIHWMPGARGRGWAAAGLLTTGVLMRNELVPAAALFALLCAVWEYRRIRGGKQRFPQVVRAYGIPLAAAALLIGFFYWRASEGPDLQSVLSRKHTLNICQVYAFGYQQRHSDFQGSPWTECQQLMQRDFGAAEPSMREALARNPRAMLEHLWWNAQLIPNGLQVLLFQGMSGRVNPDYAPVNTWPAVLPLSILVVAMVLAALVVLYRERQHWWESCFRDRIWVWIAMGCIACVMPAVMLSQRPRPSYLFVFGIALRAMIGTAVLVLVRRSYTWQNLNALPVAPLIFLIAAPCYYYAFPSSMEFTAAYHTLAPYYKWLERPHAGLVSRGWGQELCNYVAEDDSCRGMTYSTLAQQVTPQKPLPQVLEENRATVFFADSAILAEPLARSFVAEAPSYGWRRIGMRHDSGQNWEILVKDAPPK